MSLLSTAAAGQAPPGAAAQQQPRSAARGSLTLQLHSTIVVPQCSASHAESQLPFTCNLRLHSNRSTSQYEGAGGQGKICIESNKKYFGKTQLAWVPGLRTSCAVAGSSVYGSVWAPCIAQQPWHGRSARRQKRRLLRLIRKKKGRQKEVAQSYTSMVSTHTESGATHAMWRPLPPARLCSTCTLPPAAAAASSSRPPMRSSRAATCST